LLFLAACAPDGGETETTGAVATPAAAASLPQGSGFDFYVLALSWSPSYCAAEGADANRQQCGSGRPYGFVVHGLWPQFERGYPEDCKVGEREVPRSTITGLLDIMPSAGLIGYEWRKHGTCSGLSQGDYFEVLRAAREKVVIPPKFRSLSGNLQISPPEIENAFVTANPGLTREAISVACDRRYMREVRVCLTKDLAFRPCPELDRSGCKANAMLMPPIP
jgi:ribonuclease T2